MPRLPTAIQDHWLAIGQQNVWIRAAYDPPFNEHSFEGANCASPEDLVDNILQGNWCLGQVFYLIREQLCCINQVDGGDEWLTIKGTTPFESLTFQGYRETPAQARQRSLALIRRMIAATEEQCSHLDY